MSIAQGLAKALESNLRFFKNTLSVFGPEDANFAPQPVMFTVAGQVAHVAGTVDWFLEGAFGDGWDMDFDAHIAEAKAVTDLGSATSALEAAFQRAIETIAPLGDAELFEPIADTRIMGGAPKIAVVSGIVDHTAHHRGSLAVYARVMGKEPVMPYS